MVTRTGRPAFSPTNEQRLKVEIMVACGMAQTMICEQIVNTTTGKPIDLKTLRKVFRDELDRGSQTANSLVAQALFKKATGTGPQSVTAAIFWMKARAGWKDKQHIELEGHVGAGGAGPAAPADMTDEQLADELKQHGIDPADV
jgi:hypothetical protein